MTSKSDEDDLVIVEEVMIDTDIGVRQSNTVLLSLNMPVMSKTFMINERREETTIEAVAKATSLKMVSLERELADNYPISQGATVDNLVTLLDRELPTCLTITKSDSKLTQSVQSAVFSTPNETKISSLSDLSRSASTDLAKEAQNRPNASAVYDRSLEIAVGSFDVDWQTQRSGKIDNSQSDHRAGMGYHTKQVPVVLDFASLCKMCQNYKVLQDTHNCRCKSTTSAPAMESDITLQLVAHSDIQKEADVIVSAVDGFNDSSTIAVLGRDAVVYGTPNLQIPISQYKLAYFDLETTGFLTTSEVVQIAVRIDKVEYSSYIQPKYIPKNVTELTGLCTKNGCLFLHNTRVDTVARCVAWKEFLDFLATFKVPIIFVGHNISFDLRFTTQELHCVGLKQQFDSMVYGTIDTLQVLKNALPGRPNYKQGEIASSLGASDATFGAHNAVGDIRTLQNIILKLDISEEKLKTYYQSFASKTEKELKVATNKKNLKTLLVFQDVLSKVMLNKIATANLKLTDLKHVYMQRGVEGIRLLFAENSNSCPRVTKNEQIVKAVSSILQSLTE